MVKRSKWIFFILLAFVLTACSSGNYSNDTSVETGGGSYEESADMDMAQSDGESGSALIGEKVIKTVHLDYDTLDFETTTSHIMETVESFDAYVEYSSESSYRPSGLSQPSQSHQQYSRIDYTLRVPTDSLSEFLANLEGMDAYKTSEQIGSEDVTQDYRDTESRLGVLENKEARLNELLEQAESIEDILQIESQLSETIQEREILQSQLDNYDQLIDYTVVHVTVSERPRIANARGESVSFIRRVSDAFVDSFFAFYYWIQDAAIWLIYAFPFLLIIAGALALAFYARKKRKKGK